jgi:tRNA-Thr(GGU) m(6)t(6)A37 methyltransferase TsaA
MKRLWIVLGCLVWLGCSRNLQQDAMRNDVPKPSYTVVPIGKVAKEGGRTFIVLDEEYEPGLKGLGQFSHVTVVYWFDRNDTPEKRSILQVHPQGNPLNPIRGVFATHSPMRPNLIAISRCKIVSVQDNVIEINQIDAWPDSPVLDLKN